MATVLGEQYGYPNSPTRSLTPWFLIPHPEHSLWLTLHHHGYGDVYLQRLPESGPLERSKSWLWPHARLWVIFQISYMLRYISWQKCRVAAVHYFNGTTVPNAVIEGVFVQKAVAYNWTGVIQHPVSPWLHYFKWLLPQQESPSPLHSMLRSLRYDTEAYLGH